MFAPSHRSVDSHRLRLSTFHRPPLPALLFTMGHPSVYPTGTTIFDPDRCWSGYTLFSTAGGVVLLDMNGNVAHLWRGLEGFPPKLLPGGFVLGSTARRDPRYGYLDMVDVVQVDWKGNVVWKFARYDRVRDGRQKPQWMARQHHDVQRVGNPVGYYAPKMKPKVTGDSTLMLCHRNLEAPSIAPGVILDDTIIDVAWDGTLRWEWRFSDHVEEMGFGEDARNAMHRNPNTVPVGGGQGDWMHVNSLSRIGPNRLHAAGDARFHPRNVIWSARQTNIIGITDRKSGRIVWRLGPDYDATPALRRLGWIIGPHHAHIIPKGLPGEGNLLVFDNGGRAGYGAPNPGAPTGHNNAIRPWSRVLEIDPATLDLVWEYSARTGGFAPVVQDSRFYSVLVSSAQRLPNGNTLIAEGSDGRLIEVTRAGEIVWEYVSPYVHPRFGHTQIYRAYRAPYDWIPQLDPPRETAVPRIDVTTYRLGASVELSTAAVATLKRGGRVNPDPNLCVVPSRAPNPPWPGRKPG